MAADYNRQYVARRNTSSGSAKQLLYVFISFLLGYLSASIFDFTSLKHWMDTQLLAQHRELVATKVKSQPAHVPAPKFEFYTLLANEHRESLRAVNHEQLSIKPASALVHTSSIKAADVIKVTDTTKAQVLSSKPVQISAIKPAVVSSSETYLVQVAAFKTMQEVEHMKALLSLRGYVVRVTVINQHGVNWYRVNLGPFKSQMLAQKARVLIAQSEHMAGIIRKIDA